MANSFVTGRLIDLARYLVPARSPAKLAERLFRRAVKARNAGHYLAAAILYEEALAFTPTISGFHIQAGHMFKEAGDYENAEDHYQEAVRLMPGNADLALQCGHFYKLTRRYQEAEAAYARALELQPDLTDAEIELAALRGGRGDRRPVGDIADAIGDSGLLLPELAPRDTVPSERAVRAGLVVRRLGGRRERHVFGMMKILRGVEAIHGHCTSDAAIAQVELLMDGAVVERAIPIIHPLDDPGGHRKHVFNIWHDFGAYGNGTHDLELRCTDGRGRTRRFREQLIVAPAQSESAHPESDALFALDPHDPRPITMQVTARDSMIRSAHRTLLDPNPRAVLVQRTDQLGDFVVSLPAIRRLRTLFPNTRLIGLLSAANAELASRLGVFDAIEIADFPENPAEGRRTMTLDAQHDLRVRLAAHRFDIAIDLSEGPASRPLLLLSGAPFLYGFQTHLAPWLNADVTGRTHDPLNGLEAASHAAKTLALVEWLGGIVGDETAPMPRPLADADPVRLAVYGLHPDRPFVVLHAGARLVFSRWPHYVLLADLLIARTGLDVLLMSDDLPPERSALLDRLAGSGRLHIQTGRMPFEDFDMLLSRCAAFVGNDSGPKHVASLRGAPTISLHMARLNWNEWGQGCTGAVISRRVPCAGCGIHGNPEDCGRGFACITDIRPEEVFEAILAQLPQPLLDGTVATR